MRELSGSTIIRVKRPLPLPRKRKLTGETRIRLSQIKVLSDWYDQLAQDKHSKARIGEVRKWADGKLHEKMKHGWRKVPSNGFEYREGKRSKQNTNFKGYNKPQKERKEDLLNATPLVISTADYAGKTKNVRPLLNRSIALFQIRP